MNVELKNFFVAEVITPDKFLFNGNVKSLVIPGAAGEFTILANHVPLISSISSGILIVTDSNDNQEKFFVMKGFVEISTKTVVLVDNAISTKNENEQSLTKKINELKEELSSNNTKHENYLLSRKIEFYSEMKKFIKFF